MTTNALTTAKAVGKRVKRAGGHKYQADLPDPLWEELQQLAEANCTTVADLVRRFVKLGLLAADLEESEDGYLVLRRKGHEDIRIVVLV